MRLEDIDLVNPDSFNDGFPHDWFALLRRERPVYWQEHVEGRVTRGFWNLTKYEDVKLASKNPQVFSSSAGGTNMFDLSETDLEGTRRMMLNMDPPQHVRYRNLVSKNFTPRRIQDREGHIRELAREVIDTIAGKSECEFVNEVAAVLPCKMICEMVGVPKEDQPYIFDLSNKLIGFDDPDYQTTFDDGRFAAGEMMMYGARLQQAVQEGKCPHHLLAAQLYHGEVNGDRLDDLDYYYFFLILMIAGNETTRTVTANGMRLLMEHPEQRDLLVANPELIPNAIEEITRFCPPVMHFRRTVTEDVEVRGETFHPGDKVLLWYPSANRDEEIFEDPDRFDVTRKIEEHLAFGVGEHFCIGASLARTQLKAIFSELITRLPDMELVAPVKRLRSNFIDGIKEMHVRYTPERGGARATA